MIFLCLSLSHCCWLLLAKWPRNVPTVRAQRTGSSVGCACVCMIVVDNCGSLGKYNNLKRLNKIIQLFMLVKQTAENEATWPTKKTSGYPAQLNLCSVYHSIYKTGVCVDPKLIWSNYENAHVLIKLNWDEQQKRLPWRRERASIKSWEPSRSCTK